MNEQNTTYQQDFESNSIDPGVAFLEGYYQRKYETMKKQDIVNALLYAAENLKDTEGHVSFIRNLLNGELVYRTSKDERKSIFLKAAQQDHDEII